MLSAGKVLLTAMRVISSELRLARRATALILSRHARDIFCDGHFIELGGIKTREELP